MAPRLALERAEIAITLDLEMSRNYPTPDATHWDFEKGNLDDATKRYAVEAAKRVHEQGGRIHFFALGRTMEQPDVSWLQSIATQGHPVGNHSYDHVNVKAKQIADVQFRFKRAPWLAEGKSVTELIADNIRLGKTAIKTRAGIDVSGFRTPGGFPNGLRDRPDLQRLLFDQGYTWVSSLYPAHPIGQAPTAETFRAIVAAQSEAQPFVYPSGLIEVPMSPISDVTAFRSGHWKLPTFLEAIERAVGWAIDHRATFDFLAHPSCLVVEDPKFEAIDLICKLVRNAGKNAALVDLGTIAARAKQT